ncbi:N-acetylmuramoyl-L-alanine amidase [Salinicola endophyticus]|uniref:N-acetylmuramoyl-L-alanine amidase n=1 Tax=Salinicola endophyticus TaxID=1949083 RepID=A0AB74UC16_9GAMM
MRAGAGRLGLLAALLSVIAGCASSGLVQRDGYVVDRRQQSSAFNERVRYVVLHYTDSEAPRALKTLMGPKVSAHYVVARAPEQRGGKPVVWQLVDEQKRAWHAGVSAWEDRTQLNDSSIGIEIVNRGPSGDTTAQRWAPYSEKQIAAVIALVGDILRRYRLPPTAVVGHADIAPERKIDPGPAFPWQRLHAAGIAAWPDAGSVARYRQRFERCPPTLAQLQRALAAYGYALPVSGERDARTQAVLRAFQMHFRASDYRGEPDVESAATAWALLAKYHPEALEDTRLATLTCPPDSGSDRGFAP